MNEFHDGILLFEISGRKSLEQGSGRFYWVCEILRGHISRNFLTKKAMEAKIYTLKSPAGRKEALFSIQEIFPKTGL